MPEQDGLTSWQQHARPVHPWCWDGMDDPGSLGNALRVCERAEGGLLLGRGGRGDVHGLLPAASPFGLTSAACCVVAGPVARHGVGAVLALRRCCIRARARILVPDPGHIPLYWHTDQTAHTLACRQIASDKSTRQQGVLGARCWALTLRYVHSDAACEQIRGV